MSLAAAPTFDPHALSIAKRQYFQPEETQIEEMFWRVASWVAEPEREDDQFRWAKIFYDLMAQKRFCPGGRVLAGAATNHGNVLNCFVQSAEPYNPMSTKGNLWLSTKLALVTKVGGGNGLNLDSIRPKRPYKHNGAKLYITVDESHPDYQKVKDGTYMDLQHGKYVTKGYRFAEFVERKNKGLEEVNYPTLPDYEDEQVVFVGDSVKGIWESASLAVQRLLEGHDVVIDLSDLRPEGKPVKGSGGTSSGPSSFAVEIFDNFGIWASLGGAEYAGPVATLRYLFAPTLRVVKQGGTRRGAGMATISATHADVQDFITCKDLDREEAEGDISTFNISVLADDKLMEQNNPILRDIAEHAWQTGEPGLIFVDRINEHNPMRDTLGDIKATNPCGEIPLYPGEPCCLGAMNLSAYVMQNDVGLDGFDTASFAKDIKTCVRFLDNVLDVNKFALDQNREMSQTLRRIGLGVMGLADALVKMGLRYNSEEGRAAVSEIITVLRDEATKASQDLVIERDVFPMFNQSDLGTLRRNIAILTVAPTGTTSMLMGVSSGVEPIFAPFIYRKIGDSYAALISPLFRELLDEHHPHPDCTTYNDEGVAVWDWDKVVAAVQEDHGSVQNVHFIPDAVKDVLICAHDVTPADHVLMQAVVQRAFDAAGEDGVGNSISKTINMPNSATVKDVEDAYALAHKEGCKGITVYRDGSRQFQVLSTTSEKKDEPNEETKAAIEDVNRRHLTVSMDFEASLAAEVDPEYRPERLEGFTDVVKLTATNGQQRGFYVTLNHLAGKPREVFIIAGKAGDEANADAEALGRLVSIALQYDVPVEVLVKTLEGISGGLYGTYQRKIVQSKAGIIAAALKSFTWDVVEDESCPACGETALAYIEGCKTCQACGDSRCG